MENINIYQDGEININNANRNFKILSKRLLKHKHHRFVNSELVYCMKRPDSPIVLNAIWPI